MSVLVAKIENNFGEIIMPRKFEKYVERGIALLGMDGKDLKKINIDTSNMQNGEECILGQVFQENDYVFIYRELGKKYNLEENFGKNWDLLFGFDVHEEDFKKEKRLYTALTQEWKRQLS